MHIENLTFCMNGSTSVKHKSLLNSFHVAMVIGSLVVCYSAITEVFFYQIWKESVMCTKMLVSGTDIYNGIVSP